LRNWPRRGRSDCEERKGKGESEIVSEWEERESEIVRRGRIGRGLCVERRGRENWKGIVSERGKIVRESVTKKEL